MVDPTKVLNTIRTAASHFRSTPGQIGSMVEIGAQNVDDVLIVGDLHGHIETLAAVLKIAALDVHNKRHVIIQELVHDTRIDPDEGQIDRSHRVIDVACALKCQFPDRMHYLLGNHELSELTGRSISKNGFALNDLFRQGVVADYGSAAGELLPAYHDLFRMLPVFVRLPNRIVACHTIPDGGALDSLDIEVLKSGHWTEESMKRGGTIYALTWGRDTSDETADRFAAWIDADLFVCGHQPCEEGFRQANRRVLIVDGTEPAPAYCLVPAGELMTIEKLRSTARHVPVIT